MDCTLDLYTDYLLATTGSATATGMSTLFDGAVSHDKVTRFLSDSHLDGSTLWKAAKPLKPLVRRYEHSEDAVLIADDTIIHKPHTDENVIISWHYDHATGTSIKGVNLLTLMFDSAGVSVPINAHLVEKTEGYFDASTGHTKYRSPVAKNDITRGMLLLARSQNVQYRYFLESLTSQLCKDQEGNSNGHDRTDRE